MPAPQYLIELHFDVDVPELSQQSLLAVVEYALCTENVVGAEIEIVIVDDATIHRVNREHLQHDYPTDVISFLYDSQSRDGGKYLEGELMISRETAAREAQVHGWQPADELTLYVVHGLLHLCGYNDQSAEDQQLMRSRERTILQNFGLSPHYPDDSL